MHTELLDHPDRTRFREVAERMCALIERVDALPKVYFLQQLLEVLPLVYSLATRLPDPYDWDRDNSDAADASGESSEEVENAPAASLALWEEWRQRITAKMEPHVLYHYVYHSIDPNDQTVVEGDLALDLAQVYAELKDGLDAYALASDSERANALWEWRFGFNHHWGAHIAEVLLPLHRLLHNHYHGEDEVIDI